MVKPQASQQALTQRVEPRLHQRLLRVDAAAVHRCKGRQHLRQQMLQGSDSGCFVLLGGRLAAAQQRQLGPVLHLLQLVLAIKESGSIALLLHEALPHKRDGRQLGHCLPCRRAQHLLHGRQALAGVQHANA